MLRPDQNPSEDRRTPADRLEDAPTLLWWIMGVVVLVVFVAIVFWMWSGRVHG